MSASDSLRGSVLWCVGYLTVCLLQAASVHAQGERTTAILNYTRGPELPGCPSQTSLRRSVAAHLGYDPFRDDRGIRVDANIEPAAPGLVAHVEARGEDGTPLGKRELRSERGDCVELSRALALAISVAIDPFVLSRAEPQPADEPTLEVPPEDPPPAVVAEPTPEPAEPKVEAPLEPASSVEPNTSARPYLSVEGAFGWGFVPAARGGLAVAFAWPFREHLSLQGELRYDLPGSDSGPRGGRVEASLAGARLHGCAGTETYGACLGTSQSVLFASGRGVDDTERARAFLPAASAFAFAHLYRGERWLVQLRVGADVRFRRAELEINRESVWTTPRVAPYGALGLGWVLP